MKIIHHSSSNNKSAFMNGSCILKPEPKTFKLFHYNYSRLSNDGYYLKTKRIDKNIAKKLNEKKTFFTKYVDALSHEKKYTTVTRRDFYNDK